MGTGTKGSVDLRESCIVAATAAAFDRQLGFAPPDYEIASVAAAHFVELEAWCLRQH